MESPRSLIDDDVPVSEPSDESISKSSSAIITSLKTIEEPAPNSLEALLFGPSVGPSVLSVVPGTNNSELWNTSDISSTDNYTAANLGTQTMPGIPDNVTSFVTSPTTVHAHAGSSGPVVPVAPDNLNTKETATPSVAANNQVGVWSSLNTHLQRCSCIQLHQLLVTVDVTGSLTDFKKKSKVKSSIKLVLFMC